MGKTGTTSASDSDRTAAMDYREYCDFIRQHYTPRHRHLYTLRDEYFVPSFLQAVRRRSPEALRALYREVHPGVYVFDMVQPQFCADLLEEAAHFEDWCARTDLPLVRPNTMNRYGTVLDSLGFGPLLQQLMLQYVSPFAAVLYPEVGGDSLDRHHGFIVEYQVGKDLSLDFHVDASDVTLNVCLGKQFTGGELFFRGVRCGQCQQTPWSAEEDFAIEHVPGRAILHRGKHRHGAQPITGGQRYNLILWCNSSRFAREHDETRCADWCGWPAARAHV